MSSFSEKEEVEDFEINLILEALYHKSGHDFRNYAKAHIKRRILHYFNQLGLKEISDLVPLILHQEKILKNLLINLSVNVTEMFRDPLFYLSFRENIVPLLKTYPSIKIWHAGCATGQEAYSMAILLEEEGLLKQSTIYATDFNEEVIEKAKSGIFPLENVQAYTKNYQKSGGHNSFSHYFKAHLGSAVFPEDYKKKIVFSVHNLITDQVFAEIHVIVCRNVLIYFNTQLQNQVLKLLKESLCYKGFLCLGTKESLRFSHQSRSFDIVDPKLKIYQKSSDV